MNTSALRQMVPPAIRRRLVRLVRGAQIRVKSPVLQNYGRCPCCQFETWFWSDDPWLRDHYRCAICYSIPRERALMWVIEHFRPTFRTDVIHESSPVRRGASERLSKDCEHYIPSQYFPDVPAGASRDGVRCENLEALSFDDESIDLHITQDVMEHVFDPAACFREIARTLKPGGMHIFTTPLVNKAQPTECCASLVDGALVHHREPEYHVNPISHEGSLVTMRWGYDITAHIAAASGLPTELVYLDDIDQGIRAEYIEVLVTRKYGPASG